MTVNNPIGSSFDSFLAKEGILDHCSEVAHSRSTDPQAQRLGKPLKAEDIPRERREGEGLMDTKRRLQAERKRYYLFDPWQPDFAAVRDKRMSEMTPAQREDAHELWLREQMDHMPPYYQEHLLFLLARLDAVRAATHPAIQELTEHNRKLIRACLVVMDDWWPLVHDRTCRNVVKAQGAMVRSAISNTEESR